MNSENNDFRTFLPTGDELRVLLTQPYVSPGLLKEILRNRGVFIDSTDKKDLIPPFLLSFLSPDEFEFLIDSARQSEDTPKIGGHSYPLNSEEFSLADILPDDINLHSIASDPYGNYEILGAPTFVKSEKDGKQAFTLGYEIKTTDMTCNWMRSNRVFSGKVTYRYDKDKNILSIETVHSSGETKQINKTLSKKVDRIFKDRGLFAGDAERVLFNQFTNESRISFFMKFTGKIKESISFDKLTDLSLKLDESKPIRSDKLEWMRGKVSSIKLGGQAVQETFFVTDVSCRQYVIFHRLECEYKFTSADGDGSFVAVLDFPESQRKGYSESEFQISIPILKIKNKSSDSTLVNTLRSKFLDDMNQKKIDFYSEFSKVVTAPQASVI